MNFYNEIDPFAAQWIRNLIDAGHIPPGVVDERSIEDITPDELRPYTQCHFFAGIAGWSHALALAGFPASRSVWTGSCPCQPFSAAGKGAGFDDQRHLWPAWFHLIRECRPAIIFGEQVASKDAEPWVDLVHADLESVGYAFGCVPFPAASVGAPHIRDRNYWCGVGLADTDHARLEGWRVPTERAVERAAGPRGVAGGMADDNGAGREPRQWNDSAARHRSSASADCEPFRLAHPDGCAGGQGRAIDGGRDSRGDALARSGSGGGVVSDDGRPGPLHGFWRAADWLLCRDGKWRPVEPGTQPLAHGIPGRVGRLRAYGNAIVPQEAAQFIASFLDIEQQRMKEAA